MKKGWIKSMLQTAAGAALVLTVMAAPSQKAQAQSLTLCWAAWDPANALVEMSKDFTAQSGIEMNFEFVPWPNYADRMLNELNSGGKLCDLLIGDSQWIGGSAENGHYVKLNSFFDKEGISMDDFLPQLFTPTPPGQKEAPTTGLCQRWVMPMAGSTERTGSQGQRYVQNSSPSTDVIWSHQRPGQR
jgi:multiple sugar transport system substrate-binding protein